MADSSALAGAALAIQRLLEVRFAEAQPLGAATNVAVARVEDFSPSNFPTFVSRPALTVFVYRVETSRALRAASSAVGAYDQRSRLALDLHLLLTAWASNADDELRILGRAMQAIEDTPNIAGPLLPDETGWAPGDGLQLTLADLDTETVLRLFDAMPIGYQLSVPYVARTLRIEGAAFPHEPTVVTATVRVRS